MEDSLRCNYRISITNQMFRDHFILLSDTSFYGFRNSRCQKNIKAYCNLDLQLFLCFDIYISLSPNFPRNQRTNLIDSHFHLDKQGLKDYRPNTDIGTLFLIHHNKCQEQKGMKYIDELNDPFCHDL